jgi:hypothetical protein
MQQAEFQAFLQAAPLPVAGARLWPCVGVLSCVCPWENFTLCHGEKNWLHPLR